MKAINPSPLEFTKLGFASINKKLAMAIKKKEIIKLNFLFIIMFYFH